MTDHRLQTARTLAQAIAAGECSSEELTQRALASIQARNPALNALVTLNAEQALATARQVDAGLIRGPLAGVPITLKDAFETAGLRTTSSHKPLSSHVPQRDASAVARLRAAGAVILGKTNLPELAGDLQCNSPLFGRCNNPWDLERTSGGSSGGSAVSVAAGHAWLDLGSDIGGSIRIPAAFCGVAGFKATENRIPRTGHIPHLPGTARSVRHLLAFGCLARTVDDLRLGFELIAGPDGHDSEVPPLPIQPAQPVSARSLRIAWWDEFPIPLSTATRDVLKATVQRLESAGVTVQRIQPPGFDLASCWSAYGAVAGTEIALGMPRLARTLFATASTLLPGLGPLTRALLKGMRLDARTYNQGLQLREQQLNALESFLGTWDAWLCPTVVTSAFEHQSNPLGRLMVDGQRYPYLDAGIGLTCPFSLTGHPVLNLPAGLDAHGLPVGLQLIGKRWQDERLLDIGAALEPLFGPSPALACLDKDLPWKPARPAPASTAVSTSPG
ncbi:amidase [Metapseudomonas otitidis]|uniref:amidase n=1 Tax=Metapseudomonas otitidis TaxID=319939 RepID=UPI00253F67A1|nr:amidase [Pseudomonas otitidis]WIF66563.1 amidase [Pseudomonas otitidis]